MSEMPEHIKIALVGGPLDGDDALMVTPLPLVHWFRNGWDGEESRSAYPYALRLDARGLIFYAWIPRAR